MEARTHQEAFAISHYGDTSIITTHIYAENASRFRWSKLFRWQERPTGAMRWQRFVLPQKICTTSAYVLAAGDIHIWDRESGTLLHHIRSQTVGGDLTCIAWNHAWDTFMFATGSHDGAVKIWTSPASSNIPGSEASSIFAASRAPTNPANTPGTTTPNAYDADYRTDSPTGQLTSESFDPTAPSTPGILNVGPSGSPAANAFGMLPQARPSVVTFSSHVVSSSER